MSEVFVSYKAEDRRRVQSLVEALQADGLSVWWDAQIGGGDVWRQTIERELDRARCVIVVWSKRSVAPDGHFVRDEASRAQRRGTYLPILIDRVEPPLGFGENQALLLSGWKGSRDDPRYRSVHECVRAMVSGESPQLSATREGGPFFSRRGVIAASAVALAGAGIAGWLLLRPGTAKTSDSIAVLPFANLSGDPAQSYFSDGIAEELRSALARVAKLKVVARTSSEIVRNQDAKTAARRLNVQNILTGSVRLSKDLIRVDTQLVDGRTGLERWSETYDRQPGDALTIQTDIAQKVAEALNVQLGRGEKLALRQAGTSNATAHDYYLRAVALYQSEHTEANFREAVSLLNAATNLDPAYAEAYSQKALSLAVLMELFSTKQSRFRRGDPEGETAARKAIALNPSLPAAHVALAKIMTLQLNFREALEQYEKGASSGSNDANFLMEYSVFLSQMASTDKALALANKAIALDPLNPRAMYAQMFALFAARRWDAVMASARHILALAPDFQPARQFMGDAFVVLGKYDDARAQYAYLPANDMLRLDSEGILAARTGDRALSEQKLQHLRQLYGDAATYPTVLIYVQRGDSKQALDALDHAFAVRDAGLAYIQMDPFIDPLRQQPRFQALRKKLDFPAAA